MYRVLAAQLALLAPSFNWRPTLAVPSSSPLRPIPPLARRYIRASLALIAVTALIGPLRRSAPPTPAPASAHARAGILNAGIWTVHFGIDNAGRDSQRGIRDVFRDMDLDVVGMLETDLHVSKGPFFQRCSYRLTTPYTEDSIRRQGFVSASTLFIDDITEMFVTSKDTCSGGRSGLRAFYGQVFLRFNHSQAAGYSMLTLGRVPISTHGAACSYRRSVPPPSHSSYPLHIDNFFSCASSSLFSSPATTSCPLQTANLRRPSKP